VAASCRTPFVTVRPLWTEAPSREGMNSSALVARQDRSSQSDDTRVMPQVLTRRLNLGVRREALGGLVVGDGHVCEHPTQGDTRFEAAGRSPPADNRPSESEGWWRRRESNPRPKARRRGTLHACPHLFSRARREDAAKTARHQPRKISRPRAEAPRGHQPV